MTSIVNPLKAVARKAGIRRAGVAAMRMKAERAVLAKTSRRRMTADGRILCYHSIGTGRWGVNDVSPARFRAQIEFALELGYRFVPAAAVAGGRALKTDLAITFDDGLLTVATNAAPILAEFGIPWTLFVVTDWTDGRHGFGDGVIMGWAEVARLAAGGVEIGSHSVSHPDFGSLSLASARDELAESRRLIETRTGIRTNAFAIPLGQSKNWSSQAHEVAGDAGYKLIYAQAVVNRPPGTVPRTFITRADDKRHFKAALEGAFDAWEEWV
ncbi:MAG TPA: polysaccharide deacetylase family protein [Candidatus Micrarchaeaceae archaeon]|nr:polysaccharide deacetylase family protein [Candidatus Micrarchaeaceae archaeon]